MGAGISLWLNAIRGLDAIGLGDAVRAFSAPAGEAALRTSHGRELVAPSRTTGAARLQDLAIVLHRADLQRVLLDAFGRDRVHLGSACVSVEQDAHGVTAIFADDHRAQGDALVGADGLHSAVRRTLHGSDPPVYAGYTAWRGVVSFDRARVRTGESWGRGQRFGQIPMSGGRVYWFATRNAREGSQAPDSEKAELRRLFRGWHEPIEALIDATDDRAILRNDIYDRPPATHWGDGRITLTGDAAHAMTPNLGQGACQAIEDAVALARCLAGGARVVEALRAYETARLKRANQIVVASRRVGAVGQWANPVAVALRDTFVKLVGGRLQARAMREMLGS